VVAALVPAAMLCLLLLRPVWDVDIFWQLKLGELILANGGPILREPFAAAHLGEPLPAVAWAGQALFAAARQAGGWTGLRLVDALCWCGGFWAVAAACRRRGSSAGATAVALGLGFIAALATASIRPQSFAALAFGCLLALLKLKLRPWITIALALPLLVAWQNLHPSVSLAAIVLAAQAAGGWAAWARDRTRARPWAPTLLIPAAIAAMFATPDGFAILAISARNAQASMAVGASEWLPLWLPANWNNAVSVLVVALLSLGLVRRHFARVEWGDLAAMLMLLAMTALAYRFVLFWAIATVPVIATAATANVAQWNARPLWGAPLAVALVAAVTPFVKPTHFSENLPMAAAAKLAETRLAGTVFTEPEFGGIAIDTGYPRWRVSYDGRYYRYTDEEWARYGDILAGNYRLRAIERRYRPVAFLLRPSHSTALSAELDRRGSGWRRIWQDEGSAVWTRR